MPRATMADLIGRVRVLIGDPAGDDQVFTDDEIEAFLDQHREDVRYLELTAAETLTPTGIAWYTYYADRFPWEADEQIVTAGWQTVFPVTSDRWMGRWTFAVSTVPPLFIVGKVYDVHGAVADLFEAWAAKLKLGFDFSTDGQSFQRSQKVRHLLEMAAMHRRQQRPTAVSVVRPDVRRDDAGYERY